VGESDPVSWLVVEPGWAVVDREGNELGRVEEVLGDEELDIFHGVAVATTLVGRARVVPAERVVRILEGRVETDLGEREAERLEPAP
jgi:hypothetical protein